MAPPESGQHRGQRVPTPQHPRRPGRALATVAALLVAALTATTTGSASAGSFDNGTIDLYATWTQPAGGVIRTFTVAYGNELAWEGRPLLLQGQQAGGSFGLPAAKIHMLAASGSIELVYDGEAELGKCNDPASGPSTPQGAMCGVTDIAQGPDGTIYVAARSGRSVMRKTPGGTWEVFAGRGAFASTVDDIAAVEASFVDPLRLAIGPDGSVLVQDGSRIRIIGTDGIIRAFAGTGAIGNAGDGGPAVAATFRLISGVVADPHGNVFIADSTATDANHIRVVATDGIIHHFAGSGSNGFSGDGGPASDAGLAFTQSLAIAPTGDLLIGGGGRIRAVGSDGIIDTIVGNGTVGAAGDGGLALDAELQPQDLSFDAGGELLIQQAGRLRVVTWTGSLGGTATVGGAPGGAGVHVAVLEPWPSWKPVASTFTGVGGSWSIPELKTGTYTVRFFDPWGRYQRQWLGNSASYKDAAVVQVTGGLAAADVTLEARGGLLSGQVTDATTTQPVQGAVVWIIRDGAYVTARTSDTNGQWSIGDLPTGSYLLRFTHPTPWLYKGMWHHNAAALADATPVVIGPDPVQLTTELSGW